MIVVKKKTMMGARHTPTKMMQEHVSGVSQRSIISKLVNLKLVQTIM